MRRRRVTPPLVRGHLAIPGPLAWDWRCLVCGCAVADHAGPWARLLWRLRGAR